MWRSGLNYSQKVAPPMHLSFIGLHDLQDFLQPQEPKSVGAVWHCLADLGGERFLVLRDFVKGKNISRWFNYQPLNQFIFRGNNKVIQTSDTSQVITLWMWAMKRERKKKKILTSYYGFEPDGKEGICEIQGPRVYYASLLLFLKQDLGKINSGSERTLL